MIGNRRGRFHHAGPVALANLDRHDTAVPADAIDRTASQLFFTVEIVQLELEAGRTEVGNEYFHGSILRTSRNRNTIYETNNATSPSAGREMTREDTSSPTAEAA